MKQLDETIVWRKFSVEKSVNFVFNFTDVLRRFIH